MAKKNYETGLIITGDAKGAIKATTLTEDALKKLNTTNKRTAKDSSGAWDKAKSSIFGVKGAIGALGVALAGLATINNLKHIVDDMDRIGKMSTRLGATTEALSELQHVAELSGVSFNTMTMGLQRMTRRVSEAANGTGEAVKALKELHINAVDLARLRPEDQFEQIADAISGLSNESDKVRLAMKLFDSGGVSLIQTMSDGAAGIREMRAEARELGLSLSSEMTDAAAQANDNMTRLGATFEAIGIKLTNSMIPAINDSIIALMDLFNLRPESAAALEEVSAIAEKVFTLEEKLKAGDLTSGRQSVVLERYRELSADLLTASEAAKLYGASQDQVDRAMGRIVEKTYQANTAQTVLNETRTNTPDPVEKINAAVSAYDQEINALIKKNIQLTAGERALFSYSLAQKKLSDTERKSVLAIYDANKALKDQAKAADIAAKAVESAAKAQGVAAAEIAKAREDSANTLDEQFQSTEDFLNDLGATSQDIFTGMAGDINNVLQAFLKMDDAVNTTSKILENNKAALADYIESDLHTVEEKAGAVQKFAQQEIDLNAKANSQRVQGYADMAGAAGNAFGTISNLAEEGSKQQAALQKAALAFQMVAAGVYGASAIIRGFASSWWEGIAITAIVGAQLGSMGAQAASISVSDIDAAPPQGSGTIKGDEDQVSLSIRDGIDELVSISEVGLDYSAQMLDALRGIDNHTTSGLLNIAAGFASSQNPAVYLSEAINSLELKTSLQGSFDFSAGQFTSGTLQDFLDEGSNPDNRQEILNNKYQQLGYSDEIIALLNSKATEVTPAAEYFDQIDKGTQQVNQQLETAILSIIDGIALGVAGIEEMSIEETKKALLDSNVQIGQADFTGLNRDEIEKELTGIFSAFSDNLTRLVLPGIDAFQVEGEGLFQTLIRVGKGIDEADFALAQFGFSAVNYTDILDKQGDVQAGIVKETLIINEEFSNVADIMRTVNGDASKLISTYEDLHDIQSLLIGSGLGSDILSNDLIAGSGGIAGLETSLQSFFDNFYTEQEQFDANLIDMQKAFSDMNLVMPTTKDAFRDLVATIAATGDTQLLGRLLSQSSAISRLSDDYDKLTGSTDQAGNAIANLASILNGVSTTFDGLDDSEIESTLNRIRDSFLGTVEQVIEAGGSQADVLSVVNTAMATGIVAVNKAKDALNDAFKAMSKAVSSQQRNISASIAKIQGGDSSDAEKAYLYGILGSGEFDEQISAASSLHSLIMSQYEEQIQVVEELTDFVADIQGYIDDLKLNDQLSILTPVEMAAEAERQYRETLGLAQGGDQDAASRVTGEFNDFLEKARVVYASGDEYTRIFNEGIRDLAGIEAPQTENYDEINAQASQQAVSELQSINSTLESIRAKESGALSASGALIDSESFAVAQSLVDAVSELTGVMSGSINNDLATLSGNGDSGTFDYQIREFITANQDKPHEIYGVAQQVGITAAQIDRAMGWPDGSTNQWADANNLERFANGGIANQPSIFGEAGYEAAVPLPDGRSIPVTISTDSNKSYQELITEIKGLRKDMAEQANVMIEANYDANEKAAEKITDTSKSIQTDNQWSNNKVAVS